MAASASGLANIWMVAQTILDGPGGRSISYAGNILIPNKLPGISEALEMYVHGWINEGRLEKLLIINGAKWDANNQRTGVDLGYTPEGRIVAAGGWKWTDDPWMAELWDSWQRWDPETINQLLNRGVISQVLADQLLQAKGWESGPERTALLDLRHPIPAPVQLLDMAIRGALDSRNLGANALGAEYSGDFDRWARATGLDQITLPGPQADAACNTIDFPRALWALHWTLPSL